MGGQEAGAGWDTGGELTCGVGRVIGPVVGEGEFGREFLEDGGNGIQVVREAKLAGMEGSEVV